LIIKALEQSYSKTLDIAINKNRRKRCYLTLSVDFSL